MEEQKWKSHVEILGFKHSFSYHGLFLTLPDVVMAAVMKINAFQDQWNLYTTSPEQVTNLAQAEKHARELFSLRPWKRKKK